MINLLFLLLVSCTGTMVPVECVDHGDCHQLQACVQGSCTEVDCLSSSQCGLHETCDVTTYSCAVGCGDDADCLAGEACNLQTQQCESYGCRATDLDCEIGEFCNLASGECYTDTSPHCEPCDSWSSPCPSGSECYTFDAATGEQYCVSDCNPDDSDACPRGFECIDATGWGDFGCVAWCPTLLENGFL
jgi:hypothetical protein